MTDNRFVTIYNEADQLWQVIDDMTGHIPAEFTASREARELARFMNDLVAEHEMEIESMEEELEKAREYEESARDFLESAKALADLLNTT